jgi:hypothetical protein
MHLPFSRDRCQRLQIQFLIAGDYRHDDCVVIAASDQRLENLLRGQTDFPSDGLGGF